MPFRGPGKRNIIPILQADENINILRATRPKDLSVAWPSAVNATAFGDEEGRKINEGIGDRLVFFGRHGDDDVRYHHHAASNPRSVPC
jgi:hypothetical protein